MSAETRPAERSLSSGFGRLVVLVYVVFAVSAGVRAVYQVATKFDHAPVSYSLSAVAALIYLVAAVAIVRGAGGLALTAVAVELAGVVGVGAFSYAVPDWFGEASVWSHFGSGYGFVPLVLPIVGLVFLVRRRRSALGPLGGLGRGQQEPRLPFGAVLAVDPQVSEAPADEPALP